MTMDVVITGAVESPDRAVSGQMPAPIAQRVVPRSQRSQSLAAEAPPAAHGPVVPLAELVGRSARRGQPPRTARYAEPLAGQLEPQYPQQVPSVVQAGEPPRVVRAATTTCTGNGSDRGSVWW